MRLFHITENSRVQISRFIASIYSPVLTETDAHAYKKINKQTGAD